MESQPVNLCRIRYCWPDGRTAAVSLAAPASQILQQASDYVHSFTGGELLSISEERPLAQQFELIGTRWGVSP